MIRASVMKGLKLKIFFVKKKVTYFLAHIIFSVFIKGSFSIQFLNMNRL